VASDHEITIAARWPNAMIALSIQEKLQRL